MADSIANDVLLNECKALNKIQGSAMKHLYALQLCRNNIHNKAYKVGTVTCIIMTAC